MGQVWLETEGDPSTDHGQGSPGAPRLALPCPATHLPIRASSKLAPSRLAPLKVAPAMQGKGRMSLVYFERFLHMHIMRQG